MWGSGSTVTVPLLLAGLSAAWAQPIQPDQQACNNYTLPSLYAKYLNTSFLGPPQAITVDTVRYRYYSFGPLRSCRKAYGHPLLMIPGGKATLSQWTPDLLHALADYREVVIVDLPGIGQSNDSSNKPYTISSYADSLADFASALNFSSTHVLGLSLGGMIAQAMALRHPSQVGRIILADSAPWVTGASQSAVAPASTNDSLYFVRPTALFPATTAGVSAMCRYIALTQAMPNETVTYQQVYQQPTVQYPPDLTQGSSIKQQLSNLTSGVLIVAGRQDAVIPYAADEDLQTALSDASLVAYADSGHGAILQHALTNAKIISAWLDQGLVSRGGANSTCHR